MNYVINIETTCLPQQPGTHPQTHYPNREKWTQRPNQNQRSSGTWRPRMIKVTLLQNTDENIHEVAEILEEEIGVDTVQKIGRILILYKQIKQERKS